MLQFLQTLDLYLGPILVLNCDGVSLFLDDPDCLAQVAAEGHFSRSQDVVAGYDQDLVLGVLKQLDAADRVFLEGGVADEETDESQLGLAVLSLLVFVVETAVVLVVDLLGGQGQQPVPLLRVVAVGLFIVLGHLLQ